MTPEVERTYRSVSTKPKDVSESYHNLSGFTFNKWSHAVKKDWRKAENAKQFSTHEGVRVGKSVYESTLARASLPPRQTFVKKYGHTPEFGGS